LKPAADELPIEDFEIMPSLRVSFEIVTGFPPFPAIGYVGQIMACLLCAISKDCI
jgi:hypothetical protein